MKYIQFSIQGVSPLIVNRRAREPQDSDQPEQQASQRLHIGASGQPVLPIANFVMAIKAAYELGDYPISNIRKVFASIFFHGVESSIIHKKPWVLHERVVFERPAHRRGPDVPKTIFMPQFNDWRIDFVAEIEGSIVSPEAFRSLVERASYAGIGESRPVNGRFRIASWIEEGVEKSALALSLREWQVAANN